MLLPTQEMQEIRVRSLGQEDPLEEEMATHSSILAWKIHGQKSLVGYRPWSCKESDRTEHTRMKLSPRHICFLTPQIMPT